METEQGTGRRGLFGMLFLIAALQAMAIGTAIYYGTQSVATDGVLLERTGLMTEQIFPGMRKDLGEVGQKASEIKREVAGLRTAVDRVQERMGNVDRGVGEVSREVSAVNHTLTGFIQDRTSLIWGHSLNPYVLLAALCLIAMSVPLSGLLFRKARKRYDSPLEKAIPADKEFFSKRLEDISQLIEKIRKEDEKEPRADAEIRRLMLETEQVIAHARAELDTWARRPEFETEEAGRVKRTLH
jgi:hypothetical protein